MDLNQRIKHLEEVLLKAKADYYNRGQSDLADAQYDLLEEELYSLKPDSIVFNMVGTDELDGEDVNLIIPALSTLKALNDSELPTYWNRFAAAGVDLADQEFVVSNKLDGLACHLEYRDGKLVKAATRGNGLVGKSFLLKTKFMSCIPKEINDKSSLIIRGELHLTFENFNRFNQILVAGGEEQQANPRNTVAGVINSDDLKSPEEKLNLVSFRCYGYYNIDKSDSMYGFYPTYAEDLRAAEALGFMTPRWEIVPRDQINRALCDDWLKGIEMPCDGVVVRVNSNDVCAKLGSNKKALYGVLAIKPKPELVEVMVKDIEWGLGSRELTPVAIIEPVELDGALISRVGLHSVKNILDLDAIPGKTVKIVRSGGVIPRAYHRDTVEV
jgi:DNA ligase (NAD+)